MSHTSNIISKLNLEKDVRGLTRKKNLGGVVSFFTMVLVVILTGCFGIGLFSIAIGSLFAKTAWSLYVFALIAAAVCFMCSLENSTEDKKFRHVANGVLITCSYLLLAAGLHWILHTFHYSFAGNEVNVFASDWSQYSIEYDFMFVVLKAALYGMVGFFITIGEPFYSIFEKMDENRENAERDVLVTTVLNCEGFEEERLQLLKEHPEWIAYMSRPSLEEAMLVIKENSKYFESIHDKNLRHQIKENLGIKEN